MKIAFESEVKKLVNNPEILDTALSFVLCKHSRDQYNRPNSKAEAIRELSSDELASFLNELISQEDNCPRSIDSWKKWLEEQIKS